MDAVWLQAVASKDSLFASQWPASAWAANLGPGRGPVAGALPIAAGRAARRPRTRRSSGARRRWPRCSWSRCPPSSPAWRSSSSCRFRASSGWWTWSPRSTPLARWPKTSRATRTPSRGAGDRAGRGGHRARRLHHAGRAPRPRAVRRAPPGRRLARRHGLAGAPGTRHARAGRSRARLEVRHQRARGRRAGRADRRGQGLGGGDLLARRGHAGRGTHVGHRRLLRADRRRARGSWRCATIWTTWSPWPTCRCPRRTETGSSGCIRCQARLELRSVPVHTTVHRRALADALRVGEAARVSAPARRPRSGSSIPRPMPACWRTATGTPTGARTPRCCCCTASKAPAPCTTCGAWPTRRGRPDGTWCG